MTSEQLALGVMDTVILTTQETIVHKSIHLYRERISDGSDTALLLSALYRAGVIVTYSDGALYVGGNIESIGNLIDDVKAHRSEIIRFLVRGERRHAVV